MRLFVCMTYEDRLNGDLPSISYIIDHDDEDKEYCNMMRKEHLITESTSDKQIIANSNDDWAVWDLESVKHNPYKYNPYSLAYNRGIFTK